MLATFILILGLKLNSRFKRVKFIVQLQYTMKNYKPICHPFIVLIYEHITRVKYTYWGIRAHCRGYEC